MLLEGLLQLTVVLQQADVVGHAVDALGYGGQAVQDPGVHLPGIGLAADGEAGVKAELGGNAAVHLVDLCLVPVKQVHEAGLGAGGAPAAQKTQAAQDKIQLLQVRQQVLEPQGGPLAHGHRLGGLIVGIAQGGGGGVFFRKGGEVLHHRQQLAPQIHQPVPVQDQVGVVGDIAAGGPQMDDARRQRRGLAVGIDMGHDIVADLPLPLSGGIIVDIGDVLLQLADLLLRYRQAQLVLGLGQGRPQPPPGLEAHIRGEQVQHIRRGVAPGQGGFINVVGHNSPPFL